MESYSIRLVIRAPPENFTSNILNFGILSYARIAPRSLGNIIAILSKPLEKSPQPMMKETGKITTYLSITLLLALIILPSSTAYAKNPTEWPYGGELDTLRMKQGAHFLGPLNFKQKVDFSWARFLRKANFRDARFSNKTDFIAAWFSEEADFQDALFSNKTDFSSALFSKKADFRSVRFSKEAANFRNTQFLNEAFFSFAQFSNEADFENAIFNTTLNIAATRFEKGVDLRRTDLSNAKVLFDHRTFFPPGTLQVYWSQLEGHLSLNDLSCPSYWTWESAKAQITKLDSVQHSLPKNLTAKRDSLRSMYNYVKAKLDTFTPILNSERYALTEIFYHRLRDNFLSQNDRASSDGVMFELASKRSEYLKEPLWGLYGLFMGWGYKPLRFVISVFLLIVIPFAFVWYIRFYHRVLPIFSELSVTQQTQIRNKPLLKKTILKYIHFHFFNHQIVSGFVNLPARILHVLHFSTAVLLSIRFKKEWINMADRAFLTWVIVEWVLGIALYITFAVLVKSYEFGYVKGLLGF